MYLKAMASNLYYLYPRVGYPIYKESVRLEVPLLWKCSLL